MNNKNLKIICRVLFVMILALTFVLWCALMVGAIRQDQGDDLFGSFMTFESGIIILFAVVAEELIFFRSIQYFLFAYKSAAKTIAYILLLTFDILVIGLEVYYMARYII